VRRSLEISVLVALVPLALGLAACPDPARQPDRPESRTGEAAPTAAAAARPAPAADTDEDAGTVVATIDGEAVTLGDLDEKLAAELHQARMEHRQQMHEIRRTGIERLVAERLLAAEAKRMGLEDEDALIQQLIEDGTPAPTDEEVRAFYDQNQQMMEGQPFEMVGPQIAQFLHQRKKQEHFGKILEGLRAKANVTIDLPEPRVAVDASGPAKGPEDAPVTIVEFSDFECPFCGRAKGVSRQIEEAYGDQVRFVFRHFPLPHHQRAPRAAEASLCADAQGEFWALHDVMFQNQQALSDEDIKRYAGSIEGLDSEKFEACFTGGEMQARVRADIDAGRSVGVTGTPAFFVNGILITGAQPFEAFKEIIDREIERAGQGG
jgi:protein-disulfide isomerase